MIGAELWYRLLDTAGRKKGLYKQTFETPSGKALLEGDLAEFCRANESTWDEDASRRDVLIGRREVYLHIQKYLKTSSADLVRQLTGDEPEEGLDQ